MSFHPPPSRPLKYPTAAEAEKGPRGAEEGRGVAQEEGEGKGGGGGSRTLMAACVDNNRAGVGCPL